jgi:hypothetical protein
MGLEARKREVLELRDKTPVAPTVAPESRLVVLLTCARTRQAPSSSFARTGYDNPPHSLPVAKPLANSVE